MHCSAPQSFAARIDSSSQSGASADIIVALSLVNAFVKLFRLHSSNLEMSNAVVIAGIVVNILSVVGIVITNKYITEVDGFHFMVFLSFLHFAFTTIGTRVMLMMGMFSYQPAPLSGILPVAAGSLLSVAFMNLNLSYNSVGFYQVSTLSDMFQSVFAMH